MVDLLAALVACAIAGVFVVAGVEKLRSRRAFAKTLTDLGVWPGLRSPLVIAVPALELVTAAGLMLAPRAWWPAAAVVLLGSAFAVAGLLSLRLRQPVACSCLGTAAEGYLGMRQVIVLPLWLAAAALLIAAPPTWSVGQGIQLLALVVVAACVLPAVKVVRAWRSDAAHRHAIDGAAYARESIVVGVHSIGEKK